MTCRRRLVGCSMAAVVCGVLVGWFLVALWLCSSLSLSCYLHALCDDFPQMMLLQRFAAVVSLRSELSFLWTFVRRRLRLLTMQAQPNIYIAYHVMKRTNFKYPR